MIRTLTIAEMKNIQNELNEFTVEDWKSKLNINHFRTALFDELAEFLGSGRNWKWWKHGNVPDVFNEKIELIDVLHFQLSVMILAGHSDNDDCILGYKSRTESRTPMFNYDGTINHNAFINHSLDVLQSETPYHMNELLKSVGMTSEEVSALYVAKAELNYIRQEDGYKDGTYVKVQDGMEDNQRLKLIVNNFLSDDTISLNDVKKNVREEFFNITS